MIKVSTDLYFLQRPLENQSLIEQKFQQFNDYYEMVLVLNQSAEIVYINPKGCDILAIDKAESYGICWITHFIPLEQRTELMLAFEQLIQGQIAFYDTYINDIVTREGETISIRWKNWLIKDTNQSINGTLSFGMDAREPEKNFNFDFQLAL